MIFDTLSPSNAADARDFLRQHERRSVSLCDKFLHEGEFSLPDRLCDFAVVRENKKIQALIHLRDAASIMSAFDEEFLASLQSDGERLRQFSEKMQIATANKSFFGIVGDKNAVLTIKNAVLQKFPTEIEYRFYVRSGEASAEIRLPQGFSIRRCDESDFESLLPLHLGYQRTEFARMGIDFGDEASRNLLRVQLLQRDVWAAFVDGFPVSKANISAEGEGHVQIAGVFTAPQFRSLGLASFLVANLASQCQKRGKKAVLFVRKGNSPAIAAYERAGFVQDGEFAALYA